jgi:asparagine synthase (glutamine-hydrolysing)
MFALAFWDAREERALLARDRLGVKPLCWARAPSGGVRFASEAKALLAAGDLAPRARGDAVLEYLVAPCFSGVDTTPFEGIERVPAGGVLHVSRTGARARRWFAARFAPDDGDGDHVARLRAALPAAVRRAAHADAPVGAFLSGGLDSTVLCALLGAGARAFTVRFEDHHAGDYASSAIVVSDDVPFAERAARELQLAHTWVDVPRAELADDLRAVAVTDDHLPAWEQEVAQRRLARAAAREVKAVLVGDASDEISWGYQFLLDDEATRSPAAILARLGSVPIRPDRLAQPIEHFAARYIDLAAAAGLRWDTPRARRLATGWLILERWLARLLHDGDIHTMAFSLEARVPFADPALVAASLTVPPETAADKRVLREAARGLVPEAIRTRRKSALPRPIGVAALYQVEAAKAIDRAYAFLGEFVDLPAVRKLCAPGRPLDECERSALYRVICVAHWSEAYSVRA